MIRMLLFFLIPLPFFAVCFMMIACNDIFGDVEPEKIDRLTLVRIIQLRDFRPFSADMLERFTDRAEKEFGCHSANKPVFEYSFIEKTVHVYFQSHRTNVPSFLETNMNLMVRVRYFQLMKEYHSAKAYRKAELMKDVLEDMRYWQGIYLDYVRSLGHKEQSELELLLDFQRMLAAFKEDATPEEARMIDSFAKAMIAAETGKTLQGMFALPKR